MRAGLVLRILHVTMLCALIHQPSKHKTIQNEDIYHPRQQSKDTRNNQLSC